MEPSIEKDSISAHQNYEGKSNYSKKDIVGEERSVFIKNKSKVRKKERRVKRGKEQLKESWRKEAKNIKTNI